MGGDAFRFKAYISTIMKWMGRGYVSLNSVVIRGQITMTATNRFSEVAWAGSTYGGMHLLQLFAPVYDVRASG